MHRRYFECNYGSLETSWDKLFGSFHDATEAASERIKERQKTFGAGWFCFHYGYAGDVIHSMDTS
ncbi:MAG: hypothetical protein ABJJ09_20990 [Ascidiaceihabitans sp.]|uniref:hypothetical protein n=1 Tax=Ascidiaceihabitans sp. TaxID=1872644 RepID=UPI0032974EAC